MTSCDALLDRAVDEAGRVTLQRLADQTTEQNPWVAAAHLLASRPATIHLEGTINPLCICPAGRRATGLEYRTFQEIATILCPTGRGWRNHAAV
eukprot:CAMPEP_0198310906 /NCGR_PEP_ID=MMETSP1450-20131203/2803_1 /TAXON_ID=753684 ORGANISM="Madagascaria erythrocladiodes, Strain CCMP3234" /NCGR_SAMPLE_ID=MMETSP1450 /ASSEMBLY_ACC=CAM_ASM_001115 /LENGTH=93 /DNA_ID=CAMNT_0044013761 /DNA_START=452 /DNA_END=734 /DNA_ORIENTATION=+